MEQPVHKCISTYALLKYLFWRDVEDACWGRVIQQPFSSASRLRPTSDGRATSITCELFRGMRRAARPGLFHKRRRGGTAVPLLEVHPQALPPTNCEAFKKGH